MASFVIHGKVWQPESKGFTGAVTHAYATRERPGCLCTPAHPSMCIAKVGSRFILRRMPGTGTQHLRDCPSWAGNLLMVRQRSATAQRLSAPTGATVADQRADHGLRPARARLDRPRTPSRATAATLNGRLRRLWQAASLTEWQPRTDERRSWASVRQRLLDAATRLWPDDAPWVDRLFLPEPFDLRQVSKIYDRRRARWRDIGQACSWLGRSGLLLATVKELRPTVQGCTVVLRHVPDRRLQVVGNGCQALRRAAERHRRSEGAPGPSGRYDQLGRLDRHGTHLVLMAEVVLDASAWRCSLVGLLHVDALWRPVRKPAVTSPHREGLIAGTI